jgi:hypothetical protein
VACIRYLKPSLHSGGGDFGNSTFVSTLKEIERASRLGSSELKRSRWGRLMKQR